MGTENCPLEAMKLERQLSVHIESLLKLFCFSRQRSEVRSFSYGTCFYHKTLPLEHVKASENIEN